ncbi:MAG: hypothetical protein NTX25_18635 [Proteobacteria bacterium]|nr:hypothetical protein [Pseudomonadota bacterium]
MRLIIRGLWISALLLSNQLLFAVSPGNLSTIQTGPSPLTTVTVPSDAARVRIPIRLVRFEPIVLQNLQGVKRIENKPLAPVSYNLRATINRSNHFYVADWHIETVPMKWEREARQWMVEIKFYKRYGQDQELEEFVGTLPLNGRLVGADRLFTLEVQAKQQFNNKRASPVLLVEVGARATEKGNVAIRGPH